MGKIPSTIFRELYKKAKERNDTIAQIGADSPVYTMNQADKCYYILYRDVVQKFVLEGYSEKKALAHIQTWADYDMIAIRYNGNYKFVGFDMDRAI